MYADDSGRGMVLNWLEPPLGTMQQYSVRARTTLMSRVWTPGFRKRNRELWIFLYLLLEF